MKSTEVSLLQRGYFSKDLYQQYEHLSKDDYLKGLKDHPSIQTVCIRLLAENYHQDPDFTLILISHLQSHPALYTKIEIQNQLSHFGDITILCQYLGKIGHNQHHSIISPSHKKSYPLPRDIIARICAHMELSSFPIFLNILPTLQEKQLLEAIDALGFFCFYHQEVINDQLYQLIKDLIVQYENHELMLWKLVICLSAFPQSSSLLISLSKHHPDLDLEVKRSLKLISH